MKIKVLNQIANTDSHLIEFIDPIEKVEGIALIEGAISSYSHDYDKYCDLLIDSQRKRK